MPSEPEFMTILRRHLGEHADRAGDTPSEVSFVDLGLDSMTTIQLILDVEDSFDIVFPEEMLSEEVLRSPRTLADALAALVASESTV